MELGICFGGGPFGPETQIAVDIGIMALVDNVLLRYGHRVEQGAGSLASVLVRVSLGDMLEVEEDPENETRSTPNAA